MVREMDDGLWCTMTLFPRSSSEVTVRCDLYQREGHQTPLNMIDVYKWKLEKEMSASARSRSDKLRESNGTYFAYQCGGKQRSGDCHDAC